MNNIKFLAIVLIISFFTGQITASDESETDKFWDQGNKYYQAELYEEAIPYFDKALKGYTGLEDDWMVNITHCCMAFCFYNLDEIALAEKHMNSIDPKVKIKDGSWNRSISDLYGIFGNDEMQIKYLKRANKYGDD